VNSTKAETSRLHRPIDQTELLDAAIYAATKRDFNIIAVILTAAGAAMFGRVIGYVVGHEFGYWLLLRHGDYSG
jgi:membrane protein DedA with SNARE-associated domain